MCVLTFVSSYEKFETKDINTTSLLLLLLLQHGMIEICHFVEMLCLRSNHYGFFPKFACAYSSIACTKYTRLWNSSSDSPVRKKIFSEKMTKNDPKMAKVEPPPPFEVVTPTSFEFLILEIIKIPDRVLSQTFI